MAGTRRLLRIGENMPETRTQQVRGGRAHWTLPSATREAASFRGVATTSPYFMDVEGVMEMKARENRKGEIGFGSANPPLSRYVMTIVHVIVVMRAGTTRMTQAVVAKGPSVSTSVVVAARARKGVREAS